MTHQAQNQNQTPGQTCSTGLVHLQTNKKLCSIWGTTVGFTSCCVLALHKMCLGSWRQNDMWKDDCSCSVSAPPAFQPEFHLVLSHHCSCQKSENKANRSPKLQRWWCQSTKEFAFQQGPSGWFCSLSAEAKATHPVHAENALSICLQNKHEQQDLCRCFSGWN